MVTGLQDKKAVIFDMDGVLFLSSDCHEEAFRLTVKNFLNDFQYPEVAGMRTDEAFQFLWKKNNLSLNDQQLQELVQTKRTHAMRCLRERGQVAPGVFELLEALSMQYRLALVTSASQPTVELFLSLSQCSNFFEHVLDGGAVARAKPHPDIYLLAARKMNLAPQQCVVIEDAVKGAEAAFRAGASLIVVSRDKMPFLQFKPLVVVSEVKEVAKILLS